MAKFCLDAGHYAKYNQSPVVSTYYESQAMWTLHLYLKAALEQRGHQVITTRSAQGTDLGFSARGKSSAGCDCFFSLHSNACGTESVDFPVVFRAYDNLNSADTIAQKLALAVGQLMGTKQAGRSSFRKSEKGNWDYYGVMTGARAVNCPLYLLIEHSFHTNKAATLWLLEDANLRKLAELEADILSEYYGGTVTGTTPTTTAEPGETTGEATSYTVKKTCSDGLNIRQGPGTSYAVVNAIEDSLSYTIVEEQNGWGRLKSGAGWICLAYTKKD